MQYEQTFTPLQVRNYIIELMFSYNMAGFRDICLDDFEIVMYFRIACSDKSSKFNSSACTLGAWCAVLYLCVIGGTNFSFMNEGNIFCKFLLLCFLR